MLQKTPRILRPRNEFGASTDLEPSLYLEKYIEIESQGVSTEHL